jgi:hypothetical protein
MKLWSNGKTTVRVAKVYKAIRQQLDWSIALFRAKTANDRVYLKGVPNSATDIDKIRLITTK